MTWMTERRVIALNLTKVVAPEEPTGPQRACTVVLRNVVLMEPNGGLGSANFRGGTWLHLVTGERVLVTQDYHALLDALSGEVTDE